VADAVQTLDDALRQVTQEIGQEVLDTTGGDHYRSGQPLKGQPDYQEPAPTAAKPAPETEPVSKTPTVEETRYGPGGKYKSMEEWEKATIEAGNTISRLAKERDEFEARLKTVEDTVSPKPQVEDDPLDEIENFGLPKAPLKKAVEREVQRVLREAAEPYNARVKADQEVLTKYPEYKDSFNDLIGFLKENPDVERQVQLAEQSGNYGLAREFAWLKFTAQRGTAVEADKLAQVEEQGKARAQAKVDAAVPDAKRSDTRDRSSAPKDTKTITMEELEDLKTLAKSGYEQKAWARTLAPLLPKEWFPE